MIWEGGPMLLMVVKIGVWDVRWYDDDTIKATRLRGGRPHVLVWSVRLDRRSGMAYVFARLRVLLTAFSRVVRERALCQRLLIGVNLTDDDSVQAVVNVMKICAKKSRRR